MPEKITSADEYLDEITVTLRRMEVTLELMEQSLGLLIWQGMPWWRRLAAHWRDARHVIAETEQDTDEDEDTEGPIQPPAPPWGKMKYN